MEVPIYLFTGFLEAGKTKYVQEILEDKRFNAGERTLLVVCEQGEEEYDPTAFASKNVFVEYLDEESQLTQDWLLQKQKEHKARRVLMVASGANKAQAIKDAFFGPVTPQVPASILQYHPDFTLVADEAALSLL